MSILLFEFQYSNFERVTQNKLEKCVDICFKFGSTQNQNAAFRFSMYKNKKCLIKDLFHLQIKIFYKHRAAGEANSCQKSVALEMNVIHYKKSNIK